MEQIFSYGTLQDQRVQRELFGCLIEGREDVLAGYTTEPIEIEGKQFLRAIPLADNNLSGKCLAVSKAELQKVDVYEGKNYIRVKQSLRSGISAWIYVRPE